jgi:hypothetical protein
LLVSDLDDWLCSALRGDSRASSAKFDEPFATLLLRRADYHGVTALLNERLPEYPAWPAAVKDAVRRKAAIQAFWELEHRQILTAVVDALSRKGIEPLLFKGTALAYGVYVNPVWRTRGDTDLIVEVSDARIAGKILQSQGFVGTHSLTGDLISYQKNYRQVLPSGRHHSVDLHWRINNMEFLSSIFSYSELRAAANPLPRLCGGALAIGHEHALLLACLHRLIHKAIPYYVGGAAGYGGNRLIWLYDFHLLAQSFTPKQWDKLFRTAAEKGLCATTLDGLERAQQRFRTQYPDDVRHALSKKGEPVMSYFDAGALRRAWIDFTSIRRVADKLQFAREAVFPSAAYMRAKYAPTSASLPWLYTRRAAVGFMKLVRKTPSQ